MLLLDEAVIVNAKTSCRENISWIFPASIPSFFKVSGVVVIGTESSLNF